MSSAVGTLRQIGALDEKENLTPLGQHLAALPVDVRVGKMLLYGAVLGCLGGALLQLDIRVVERAWLQRSNLKYDKQLSSLALNISSCGTTAGAGADHRRGARRALAFHGRAVQVPPIKSTLKAPGTKRLELKYDEPLSNLLSNSACAATSWRRWRSATRRTLRSGCSRRTSPTTCVRSTRSTAGWRGLTLGRFSA